MFKFTSLKLIVPIAAAILNAAPASAVVITFDPLTHVDDNVTETTGPYIESGFQLTGPALTTFGTLGDRYPGSTSLFSNEVGGVITLTQVGGAPFTLNGISAANLNRAGSQDLTFTGNIFGGGTVSQTFTLNSFQSLTDFVFLPTFTNLASVDFAPQISPYYQFDNIIVNAAPESAPELDGTASGLPFAYMTAVLLMRGRRRTASASISPQTDLDRRES